MKKIFIALMIGTFAVAPAFAAAVVGKPAPAFSEKDMAGKTIDLSQYKGKTVVLEWLNHGCPFVVKHYNSKNMQALQKKYTDQKTYADKAVVWLSVISSKKGAQGYGTPEETMKQAKEKGSFATTILIDEDGSMGKAYGAKTTPHMFVIDASGVLTYAGAIDDKATTELGDVPTAKNFVAAALDEMLAGKPVSIASSKAYGCGVKY